jgi:hypothetical protein
MEAQNVLLFIYITRFWSIFGELPRINLSTKFEFRFLMTSAESGPRVLSTQLKDQTNPNNLQPFQIINIWAYFKYEIVNSISKLCSLTLSILKSKMLDCKENLRFYYSLCLYQHFNINIFGNELGPIFILTK